MELGEKLRQARLRAGLSQRQLCGQEITRNMLSQIEHGTCNPSVATLRYLAGRLELPVSYFLEEDAAASANAGCMRQGWEAYEAGDDTGALSALGSYREPDPLLDREYALLKTLTLLRLAEKEMNSGREAVARKRLNQAQTLEERLTWLPELAQRRLLLQARLGEGVPERELGCLDDMLLLHGASALEAGRADRAAALLDACEDQQTPRWLLLRARAYIAQSAYAPAARLLQKAEGSNPSAAIPMLEACYSAMGDYRKAYEYACKGRKISP